MEVDRPDLALLSWKQVRRYFRTNPVMTQFVAEIERVAGDSTLHASTSLDQLVVSPKHRWDAKVSKFTVSSVDQKCGISFWDKDGKETETINGDVEEILRMVSEYTIRLLSEYELQRN